MRSLTQWFGQHTKRAGHDNAGAGAMTPRPNGAQPALPSICVDHLHAQCSLRERKTSCGNTKCPRVHITLPQNDTSVHDIPELRTHLQYLPTLLVAVDRRSKHSNPLVIRLPARHALFTVGITKAVDCAFHGGQRVPYVCYDFIERTCAYGSQCYGIHVFDLDLQSLPRERFRAAIGERDLPNAEQPVRNPGAHHARTASQGSSHSHHVRTASQSSAASLSVLSSFPTPMMEVGIPVPDAFSMTCVENESGWMSGMETTCSSEFEETVAHPHSETVRMMHDGVHMVNAAHEANVALMTDVETFFSAAERVLRVAKQTCAQQCQAVVAKRLHDVSEHLQTLLSLQRSPQPPGASLRMTHDMLMSNVPHNLRTVAPHETAVSFVGDIIVPRITYARHDGVVESVQPPVAHPPTGWNPMPQSTSAGGFPGIPHSMSAGAPVSSQVMPTPLLQSMPSPSTQPGSQAGEASLTGSAAASSTAANNSAVDEEEWAVVQLLQMVQSALSH